MTISQVVRGSPGVKGGGGIKGLKEGSSLFQDTKNNFQIPEHISTKFPQSTKAHQQIDGASKARYLRQQSLEQYQNVDIVQMQNTQGGPFNASRYPSLTGTTKTITCTASSAHGPSNFLSEAKREKARNDLRRQMERKRGMSINIQKNMIQDVLATSSDFVDSVTQKKNTNNLIDFTEFHYFDLAQQSQDSKQLYHSTSINVPIQHPQPTPYYTTSSNNKLTHGSPFLNRKQLNQHNLSQTQQQNASCLFPNKKVNLGFQVAEPLKNPLNKNSQPSSPMNFHENMSVKFKNFDSMASRPSEIITSEEQIEVDDSLDMHHYYKNKKYDSVENSPKLITHDSYAKFTTQNYSPKLTLQTPTHRYPAFADATIMQFQHLYKERNNKLYGQGLKNRSIEGAQRFRRQGNGFSKRQIYGVVQSINESSKRKGAPGEPWGQGSGSPVQRSGAGLMASQMSEEDLLRFSRQDNNVSLSVSKKSAQRGERAKQGAHLSIESVSRVTSKDKRDFQADQVCCVIMSENKRKSINVSQESAGVGSEVIPETSLQLQQMQILTPNLARDEPVSSPNPVFLDKNDKFYKDLDERIMNKKEREKNNTKQFWQDVICGMPAQQEHLLVDPKVGRLEKRRLRVVSQYEQQIRNKQQMLKEASELHFLDYEPQARVTQIFEKLSGNNRDPVVNKALEEIEPQTARFLADFIGDVMTETEKTKKLKQLSKQVDALITSKLGFDCKMLNKLAQSTDISEQKQLKDSIEKLQSEIEKHNLVLKEKSKKDAQTFLQNQFKRSVNNKIENAINMKLSLKMKQMPRQQLTQQENLEGLYLSQTSKMQSQLDKIFASFGNLGTFYHGINTENLWKSEKFQKKDTKGNQGKKLNDLNMLYTKEVSKKRFYNHLGKPHLCDDQEPEMKTCLKYMSTLERAYQISMPIFSRIQNNQLFLSEINVTKEMTRALSDYLASMKDHKEAQIKSLNINGCNLRDEQLSQILDALLQQAVPLQTIVYSKGELSNLSMGALKQLIPNLTNLHISQLTNSNIKHLISQILETIDQKGKKLQRLKLSNMGLGDPQITSGICSVLDDSPHLIHLDLSWSKLLPRYLNQIVKTLANLDFNNLRNLNLAYNSLVQPPRDENLTFKTDQIDLIASRQFVENMCLFLQQNDKLTHLDLSGMNFNGEQLLQISECALNQSEQLLAIHLSDNNINFDIQLRNRILKLIGLTNNIYEKLPEDRFRENQRIQIPENLIKIIKMHTLSIVSNDKSQRQQNASFNQNTLSDANLYTNRLMQTKMLKNVTDQKIRHSSVLRGGGVGRLATSFLDEFVLSRHLNRPELAFNQQPYIDAYFSQDAAEEWRVVQEAGSGGQGIGGARGSGEGGGLVGGGCPHCNRHKYTIVFFEQDLEDPWSFNEELIEITEQKVVERIKADLNLEQQTKNDIAPIIVGSVVSGGNKRKLKMMRADYFSFLSIVQSVYTADSQEQIDQLKEGLLANLKRSQDIPEQQPHVQSLQGWQRSLIIHKCFKNDIEDVHLVNFPQELLPKQQAAVETEHQTPQMRSESPSPVKVDDHLKSGKPCSIYVFAAYLPPGTHNFLIYCPKTNRAFCKDIVVNLSEGEPYPEYPKRYTSENGQKKRSKRDTIWSEEEEEEGSEGKDEIVEEVGL